MTALHPSAYPWIEPIRTGVLRPDGLRDETASIDLAELVPVVAVGSNAAPTVLRHKLGSLLHTGLPVAAAAVEGLAVGHSAHVSVRGYVAAAPARGPAAQSVTVAWCDAEQLAALDATEPNYRRVPLPARMPCRLAIEPSSGGGQVANREPSDVFVEGAQIYDSVHGVLGEDASPLPLGSQSGVLRWLAARLPSVGELSHERLLEEGLREEVRLGVLEAGLVMDSGLTD